MKIKIIKLLDYIVGKPLCLLLSLFTKTGINKTDINNILIIRPGGIGDAVLLLPSLKVLKTTFKDIKVDILAEKRNSGIFEISKYVDNLYLYDDFANLGLFKAISKKYDVVIDTEQWHRLSAVISYFTGATTRIGFDTNERAKMFTSPVNYSQDDYEAVSFLNLISVITGKKHKFNPNKTFLEFNSDSTSAEFLEYKKRYDKVVGIFSGATVDERKWGKEKYTELAERLSEKKIGIVLLGGKSDLNDSYYFNMLLGQSDHINLIGKTSLKETINIISQLDLLISTDSGLMHIAYGVGTGTVSLFGAGIQNKWAPKGNNNEVINLNLECSPCTKFGYTPKCPYQVKCLRELDTDNVFIKVVENLAV